MNGLDAVTVLNTITSMSSAWLAPPPILAFISTVHLGLVALRGHRTPAAGTFSFVTLVSLLLAASPWLMPSAAGIMLGLAVHAAWFVACERLLNVAAAAPKSEQKPAPRPASAPAAPARKPGMAQMARTPRPAAPAPGTSVPAPGTFVQAPVMAVFDETPDIRTFRMARPEGFEFKAGQFLTLRVRADGKEHVRCYSVSSPPESRGHLEVTVKRLGLVSGALHATVRPGSMLWIRPPAGAFVYPANEDRPIALIAGGVGITPLMSMLRHALDAEPARPLTLFYSVRTVEDIAFHDEIALLNRRHAQFRAFIAISDGPPGPGHFPGRIDDTLLSTTMPDIAHAVCLVCGPQPMIDAMTALLLSRGVPRGQINFEIFQAAVAASGGAAKKAAEPAAPASTGAHQVRFDQSDITATVENGQSLLEVAESCGAEIPSLCRAGICGTCRTRVVSGDVRCTSTMLADEDRADGYVLSCVTHALGDCTVDA